MVSARPIRWVLTALLLLLPTLVLAQTPGVAARIDRARIGLNETVTLEVRIELPGRLRFGLPAGPDFEVLSQATSTSQRFDQSGAYSVTTRILRLRPMRTGTLTIGPMPIETSRGVVNTEAFTVEVVEHAASAPAAPTPIGPPQPPQRLPGTPAAPPPPSDPRATPAAPSVRSDAWAWGTVTQAHPGEPFLVARVSRTDPVAGEQFFVEYLLCSPLTAFGLSLVGADQPEFTGVWFRDLTELRVDRRSLGTQRINNEMYDVNVLNSFVVVPLRPGELVIPPLAVDLSIDSLLQGRRVATFQSQPLALQVQTVPEERRPAGFHDGNVGRFEIELDLDRTTVRAGEAVTATLRVRGAALMSRVRLPELPELANTRLLSATDRSSEDLGRSGWLEGFAARTVSLLAVDEGQIDFPAITLAYWDPFTSEFRTIQTEAATVTVSGRAAAPVGVDTVDEEAPDHWSDTLPAARAVEDAAAPSVHAYWRSPAYLVALLAPPLLLAGTSLGRRGSRRLQERRHGKRSAEIDKAVLRDLEALDIDDPAASATIVALLHEYLGTRLARPTRGQTLAALREQVRTVLGEEATALVGTLEAAERARYGGASSPRALRDAAIDALRRQTEPPR